MTLYARMEMSCLPEIGIDSAANKPRERHGSSSLFSAVSAAIVPSPDAGPRAALGGTCGKRTLVLLYVYHCYIDRDKQLENR